MILGHVTILLVLCFVEKLKVFSTLVYPAELQWKSAAVHHAVRLEYHQNLMLLLILLVLDNIVVTTAITITTLNSVITITNIVILEGFGWPNMSTLIN